MVGKPEHQPVIVFQSYSHLDARHCEQLQRQLRRLQEQGLIESWYDRQILPGSKFNDEIQQKLNEAHIVLCLVSEHFLDSNYCRGIELATAIKLCNEGKLRIVPIILRDVDLHATELRNYNPIPDPQKPIVRWRPHAAGWHNVYLHLKRLCGQSQHNRSAQIRSHFDDRGIPRTTVAPVGRESETAQVYDLLKFQESHVITGTAGVGKTTVHLTALTRLITNDAPYTHACYHTITERDDEDQRLNRLLAQVIGSLNPLAAVEAGGVEARIAQVRSLASGGSVLLLVDNADDPVSRNVVERVHRELPEVTLSVTSRYRSWKDLRTVPIVGLTTDAGVELFSVALGRPVDDKLRRAIVRFCRMVRGHPMMIRQTARDIREGRGKLADLSRSIASIQVGQDLAKRYEAVLPRLEEGLVPVLQLIGFLVMGRIRVDLVKAVTGMGPEALGALEDEELIELNADRTSLNAHAIFQAWCRRLKWDQSLCEGVARFYVDFLHERRRFLNERLREIDDEWTNILTVIDRVGTPSLGADLVLACIGDHYDDPNGYVPKRWLIRPILERCDRILGWSREIDARVAAALAKNLGQFTYWEGDYDTAQKLILQAREHYNSVGDQVGFACTTWLLGYLADDENRYREAYQFYKDGTDLAMVAAPANNELIATGHHLLGCTLYHQGRFEDADAAFNRALGLVDAKVAPDLRLRISRRQGYVALAMGRLDDAEGLLMDSACTAERLGRTRDHARTRRHIGVLLLERGDVAKALMELRQTHAEFRRLRAIRGEGQTLHDLAVAERMRGDLGAAQGLILESLRIARETKALFGEAAACQELACILERGDEQTEKVIRNRVRAFHILTVIGHRKAAELERALQAQDGLKTRPGKEIRAAVFDLMDTLAYLKPGVYESTQESHARQLGVSLDRFRDSWSRSRKLASTGGFATTADRIRWVANDLRVDVRPDSIGSLAADDEVMWRDHVVLYDDSRSLLDTLHAKGLRLAVVSNGPQAMACLEKSLHLMPPVELFLLSSKVGVLKPDVKIYREAARRLHLKPEECVFVGDGNDHELDGARSSGMYTIKIVRPNPPYARMQDQSIDWDHEVRDLMSITSVFP
jgi:HAD superfamily hydrolase (TIGR01509 family)